MLVVENGYLDRGYYADVPYATTTPNPAFFYDITSAPEPHLHNNTFQVYVGNVVGGGSIVNGMACTRGSEADYNSWEQLGNPGWGWDGLFPYFLKSTNYTPPVPEIVEEYGVTWDESAWGDDGPVQIGHTDYFYPDTKPFRASWIEQGIPVLQDAASGNPNGLSWQPTDLDTQTGTRSSSRAAYYDPVETRPNLHLLTGHKALEILFKEETLEASGVLVRSRADNSTFSAVASKEVILAAGGIFTPHLLQRSGVGPAQILELAGLTVKKDLPGVGANLQDHPTAYMGFNVSNLSQPNPTTMATNATFNETAWEQYAENKTGPYTGGLISNNANSGMFLPLSAVVDDYQDLADSMNSQSALDFLPEIYSENAALLQGFEAQRKILHQDALNNKSSCCEPIPSIRGTAAVALQKPLSRGTVTLDPTDLDAPPIVQWNALTNPVDTSIMVAMVRFEREHWSRPELAVYEPVENLPGAQYQTDEEILEGLITTGILGPTLAHPSGTGAMMPEDLGGVVSSDLLVYGTERLSIVDASILPLIPGSHLQMTMYAVAEKAADIIKSRNA